MEKVKITILSILLTVASTKLAMASHTEHTISPDGTHITNVRNDDGKIIKNIQILPPGSQFAKVEIEFVPDCTVKTKKITIFPTDPQITKIEIEYWPDGKAVAKETTTYATGSQFTQIETEFALDGITKVKEIQTFSDGSQRIIPYSNGKPMRAINLEPHDGIIINAEFDADGNDVSKPATTHDDFQVMQKLNPERTIKTVSFEPAEDEVLY